MSILSTSTSKVSARVAADASTESPELHKLEFYAMGTQCKVLYATQDRSRNQVFEQAVTGWVLAFEAKFSRYRSDSLLSQINAAAGGPWVEIDQEMEQMLQLCGVLWSMSGGVLDASALPLLQLWDYKRRPQRLPSEAEIEKTRRLVGWPKVELARGKVRLPLPGMALDFGGFGKEWAVDMVAQIARNHDLEAALIDFGHDLRAFGRPPGRPAWHVGLEDPLKPGTPAGSIALPEGRGVASSGDYLRCFDFQGRRYGHIIDPRTGRPVSNGCLQATAVADSCLRAGVLTTTAFVLGAVEGIQFIQSFQGAEGMIVGNQTRAQTRAFWHYVVT